jgi:hypothetical protein
VIIKLIILKEFMDNLLIIDLMFMGLWGLIVFRRFKVEHDVTLSNFRDLLWSIISILLATAILIKKIVLYFSTI